MINIIVHFRLLEVTVVVFDFIVVVDGYVVIVVLNVIVVINCCS